MKGNARNKYAGFCGTISPHFSTEKRKRDVCMTKEGGAPRDEDEEDTTACRTGLRCTRIYLVTTPLRQRSLPAALRYVQNLAERLEDGPPCCAIDLEKRKNRPARRQQMNHWCACGGAGVRAHSLWQRNLFGVANLGAKLRDRRRKGRAAVLCDEVRVGAIRVFRPPHYCPYALLTNIGT